MDLKIFSNLYPKFSAHPQIFYPKENCEGFEGGERYFEIKSTLKTNENWDKDYSKSFFIDESLWLPNEHIKDDALRNIHIIGHTEHFWISLDPIGTWPVLHAKDYPIINLTIENLLKLCPPGTKMHKCDAVWEICLASDDWSDDESTEWFCSDDLKEGLIEFINRSKRFRDPFIQQ